MAIILRDFSALGGKLPGVRARHEQLAWPSKSHARAVPASVVNNGGDYVTSRRSIMDKYAGRWLLALHDQDPTVYAHVIFGICVELAEDSGLSSRDIPPTPQHFSKSQVPSLQYIITLKI